MSCYNHRSTRNSLKSATLEGILLTKSFVKNSGPYCYNYKILPELIKKMNSQILYSKEEINFPAGTDSDSSSD